MDNIVCKVAALGGTISTTDISHMSEYKRLLRAKERGDLIKLRHGIYAVPDALLNTMIDVERIVQMVLCAYTMPGLIISFRQLCHLLFALLLAINGK